MGMFKQVKCSDGVFRRAVKTADGYLTGAAAGRPPELIPFAGAELATPEDTKPAPVVSADPVPAASSAPVVATIAPTKNGNPRVLTVPKVDTFACIARDLEADAETPIGDVGRHDTVLKFYAARVRALVDAFGTLAPGDAEFKDLVKDAVREAIRDVARDALGGAAL